MSVINTNITSMIGQSNLSKSQSSLQTSMERLSSGLRINSAKDDAAGQAIANRMTSQITGLSQAQRNANDGISVAQTAEGALNQVNDNLQRVRELTVQAQNGTNSQDDLNSIQAEIDQRLTEIDRISDQTDFNGVKVLQQDGALKIQVGANDNEAINIGLEKIDATSLGLNKFTVSGDKAADLQSLVKDFGATGNSDFTVSVYSDQGAETAATAVEVDLVSGTVSDGTNQLYVSQTTGRITSAEDNVAAAGEQEAVDAIATAFNNIASGESKNVGGVTWTRETAGSDANGNGTYSATIEGREVEITIADADTTATMNVDKGSLHIDAATLDGTGTFEAGSRFTTFSTNEAAREVDLKEAGAVYAGSTLDIGGNAFSVDTGGKVTADGAFTIGDKTFAANDVVYIKDAGKASQSLISQDEAVEGTRNPMEKLDAALSMVDTLRSDLGAIQNRFESAITNLQTNETNLSSARSRIEDADYATEVANMTRAQILQQAGTSVLAQANQIPQNVLSLLG
ncbi:flagellin N-terminal helical domain-containing protein [Halomonas sp. 86]|uniref:flagellin N-terminal helical domain-containing protein n=1 Tax=unclassified Halomonas TaxID=2609666 RepID=UPI004034E321